MVCKHKVRPYGCWVVLLSILLSSVMVKEAYGGPALSTGQTLYVPVYSHVFYGSRARHFNIACTLSIRNSDPVFSLEVVDVLYHGTKGELIRKYIDAPVTLKALESVDFYIKEKDTSGGSGANFIIRWKSSKPMNPPVVESIMIGVEGSQGISFISPAREIVETRK